LLDIQMPGKDGFEVCKEIKDNPAWKDIPVIFLSSYKSTDKKMKAFSLGAVDYIEKPYVPEEVIARIMAQLKIKNTLHKVNQLNLKLENQNKECEKTVEKRTAELKSLYEELIRKNKKVEELNKTLSNEKETINKAHNELESLEKTKSDFLSIISHHLRTPLNGIINYRDFLLSTLKTPEQQEYIKGVIESSNKLLKHVKLAQLITQLKLGKFKLDIKPFLFKEFWYKLRRDEIDEILRPKNISTNLKLNPEDLPLMVDEKLFRKCILALIENSVNFSDESSQIVIIGESSNNEVIIKIIDNGSGFSKKGIKNFGLLYAIEKPMNISEELGLGLATVKFIMDVHSGEVSISNREPFGAVITLKFKKDLTLINK